MLTTGIYQITNVKNGKVYIGSTNNFESRKNQHFKELRSGKHVNTKLQADFNAYGEKYFTWKIVEYTMRSNRLEIEQTWINRMTKTGKVYNTATASSAKTKKTIMGEIKKILKTLWRSILEKVL